MIPYKRDFITLNKSVINYLQRCSYHSLYHFHWAQKLQLSFSRDYSKTYNISSVCFKWNFLSFQFFHRWRYLFLSNFRFVTNFSQKKFLTTKYDQVDHNTLTHTYFLFTDDKTFTTNNELGWKCQNNKVKFINVCYCIQFL